MHMLLRKLTFTSHAVFASFFCLKTEPIPAVLVLSLMIISYFSCQEGCRQKRIHRMSIQTCPPGRESNLHLRIMNKIRHLFGSRNHLLWCRSERIGTIQLPA